MPSEITEKHFPNKKFYVYLRKHNRKAHLDKAISLIKSFGGQVETFLDTEISYVLTDIPGEPDAMLERAARLKVKIMSLKQLVKFCQEYAKASGGSDENENALADAERYFMKIENESERIDPLYKDFRQLPNIRIKKNLQIGQPIFEDPTPVAEAAVSTLRSIPQNCTPNSIRSINQNVTPTVTPSVTPNGTPNTSQREQGVRRRSSAYCEICDHKIVGKIEDHIQTQTHKDITARLDWSQLETIINTLPSLSSLGTMRRLTNYIKDEQKEFICLHKTESLSQLFDHSKNN